MMTGGDILTFRPSNVFLSMFPRSFSANFYDYYAGDKITLWCHSRESGNPQRTGCRVKSGMTGSTCLRTSLMGVYLTSKYQNNIDNDVPAAMAIP